MGGCKTQALNPLKKRRDEHETEGMKRGRPTRDEMERRRSVGLTDHTTCAWKVMCRLTWGAHVELTAVPNPPPAIKADAAPPRLVPAPSGGGASAGCCKPPALEAPAPCCVGNAGAGSAGPSLGAHAACSSKYLNCSSVP